MDLAAHEGLGAVTVRNLTRLAGVSTGSFYARFSGTDECLLAAYNEVLAGVTRRVAATRSAELDLTEQIEVTLRVLIDHLAADPVVARFVLIEIYGGGPAALAAISAAEKRLEAGICGCLDRRASRVPKKMSAAILAASLHCARVRLIGSSTSEARANRDALIEWARDVVDGREDYAATAPDLRTADFGEPPWPVDDGTTSDHDERNMILAAVLRLAAPDGFFGLTAGKVSSAAGVPTSRLRRHFPDVADGYLAAIRRTCRSFFIELTDGADRDAPPRVSVRSALRRASHRAALEPAAARLTFQGIVEPGVAGLTCRDALISELAAACTGGPAACGPSVQVRAEARAAAFWADLAMTGAMSTGRN
ncbi:MAG TPA: TetR/AcrR family transcriptional regulator [Solirubrobacterales bacterium]|jgi:AcrR family transcriptional regulator